MIFGLAVLVNRKSTFGPGYAMRQKCKSNYVPVVYMVKTAHVLVYMYGNLLIR